VATDIYDDPRINAGDSEYPNQVRFDRVGDKVRGRVLSIEVIDTTFGPTLKYMLFTGDRQVSMLAGTKNLHGQMLSKRPRPGDVIDVELIELRDTQRGTAKIFDVKVEPGDVSTLAPPPRVTSQPQGNPYEKYPGQQRPSAPDADDADLFDR
jgi:hypothetical protein